MAIGSVAGRWTLRAGIVAMCLLVTLVAAVSVIASDDGGSGGVGDLPSGTPESVEPTPRDDPGTGIVPPTPTPTEGRDNEAMAPGTVTVVIFTSDSNPLPNRATVCVGAVCQSGSNMKSGVSFWFDKLQPGWHQVTVDVGAPYGSTSTTVDVQDGVNRFLELTVSLVESAPGESAGPSRPVNESQQPAPGVQLGPAAAPATTSSSLVAVLPSTGANPQGGSSRGTVLAIAALASATLAVAGRTMSTRQSR